MSEKKPYKYDRKVCIFCGGTPVTEEHIWPRWSHSMLPPAKSHSRNVWTIDKRNFTYTKDKTLDRQGSPATIRFSRVCGACNSGWMSRHEEAVRPFLEPIASGEPTLLDDKARRHLAEYLTYKALVMDWEGELPVVSDEHRHRFYEDRTIPRHTQIFLFKCGQAPWRLNVMGHSAGLHPGDKPGQSGYNTKTFAVGFGYLFAMIVLASDVSIEPRLSFEPGLSVCIHPYDGVVRWPPPFRITARQAQDISSALFNIDTLPGFRLEA